MKLSWLTLSLAAVALTGCGSMVYGPTPAPVVSHNQYGQPVNLNPNVAQTGNAFAPAVQQQPPRVPVAQAAPAQAQRVQQPSPYQQAVQNPVQVQQPTPTQAQAQAQAQAQQGWNTPAQPAAATQTRVYDEPKLPGTVTTQAATTPPPAVETRATPVRPPERTTASTTPAATTPSTPSTQASTPPPVETRQQPQAAEPARETARSNTGSSSATPARSGGNDTAVSSLLKQASASLGKGDLDGAAAYLENAQRIEPQNSKILYDIANIRYHQGRHREAESMASRAVQVGGDNSIKKKAWSLISKSRSELGDHQGAINAANRANDL